MLGIAVMLATKAAKLGNRILDLAKAHEKRTLALSEGEYLGGHLSSCSASSQSFDMARLLQTMMAAKMKRASQPPQMT